MPENKPLPPHLRPGAIEDQVTAAANRGDFDELPGSGRPLPGLDDDPLWWVKEKLRRENVSFLPESLQLRRDLEIALEEMRATRSEMRAREILVAINDRIRTVNSTLLSGPPSNLMPLDVEETIGRWERGEL